MLLFMSKLIARGDKIVQPDGPVPTANEASLEPLEFILTNRLDVDPEYEVKLPPAISVPSLNNFMVVTIPFKVPPGLNVESRVPSVLILASLTAEDPEY